MSEPGLGHNSGDDKVVVVGEVRALIERIERLEADKADIAQDIKEVYVEAKSRGFNTKMLRQMVRERKMDPEDRHAFYAEEEIYRDSLALTAKQLEDEGLL